jgi:NifU-like protein involved in Fe-S cluster formation
MSGAERLYTPELLALTLKLAEYPWDAALPLTGRARSKSCGSTLEIGLALGEAGGIEKLGLKVHACAVGQATAAIFAAAVAGRTLAEIEAARAAMLAWLSDTGPAPDWPGIAAIEPARAYPARHGAMMLPWDAALAALSSNAASD